MRGYVMVGSSNLKGSKSFYDSVLAVIGIVSIYEDEVCVGYAHEGNSDVEFYITNRQIESLLHLEMVLKYLS